MTYLSQPEYEGGLLHGGESNPPVLRVEVLVEYLPEHVRPVLQGHTVQQQGHSDHRNLVEVRKVISTF